MAKRKSKTAKNRGKQPRAEIVMVTRGHEAPQPPAPPSSELRYAGATVKGFGRGKWLHTFVYKPKNPPRGGQVASPVPPRSPTTPIVRVIVLKEKHSEKHDTSNAVPWPQPDFNKKSEFKGTAKFVPIECGDDGLSLEMQFSDESELARLSVGEKYEIVVRDSED